MHTNGYLHFRKDLKKPIERRVQGFHDLRLDGIGDLVYRARGATVFERSATESASTTRSSF
jgi:hypothetical protein